MLHIRVLFALITLALIPATASADLRSPMLGETSLLSDVPLSRTYPPVIATNGNRTYVAYTEERTGVTVNVVGAAGTEVGAGRSLQAWGTSSVEEPRIAVSGEHVYVAWIQGSLALPERHAVVAASHDGGRTWEQPVRAGNPTGHGAWDLRLAADGDTVFVAYADNAGRIWTAGSRDGARSFACFATVSPPGDGASHFDVAVDGERVYWSWLDAGYDVMVRRSENAGRTIEPVERVHDTDTALYPGAPVLAADGGTVAVVFGQRFAIPREDRTGTDFGAEPRVALSTNGGASFSVKAVGGASTRCLGDYCAEYDVDVDGGRTYVGWRAQGAMWLARGEDGFTPRALGPYLYTWHTQSPPAVDAHGDSVVAVWHSAPSADNVDLDPVAAFSSDRGQTFSARAVDTAAGQDMLPVASAWGPDPSGAGVAWWAFDTNWTSPDSSVKFVPMSSAQPDVAVVDVRPHQVAQDAARLAAGRPTTIRAMLRSLGANRRTVRVTIELAYDQDGQRVERTVHEDVVVRPGLNPVHLLAGEPPLVGQGRITATVTVEPEGGDSDPANNTAEGSRAVVQPHPLKLLFVPVHADDEGTPACRDVQDVAEGTERYLEAAWPVDPATFEVVTDCASRLMHPAGLTEAGLMDEGMLMARLDRLKWSADVDKVVGVVPQGWFSRQLIDGFQQMIGLAPIGGGFDAALVERQSTGGWVVAHELAHNLGREHLSDEPAPGYWVADKRDIAARTLDFLHHNTDRADVTDFTGRWTSKATWDFLTTTLSTGVIEGLAADGDVLSLTGSVAADGTVKAGPAFTGEGSAPESTGPYTVEQLGADGQVLAARAFGTVNELGVIGKPGTSADHHVKTAMGAFSLRVPAHADARTLRIRRGDDVLHTRTRSAATPTVTVATPARVQLGDDLKITWEASDADGDTLTSLVSLSTDGGATWRSLGDATTGRELTTKAIVSIAGPDVRVRVTTTDGWNTAVAESGAFAVGGQLTDGLVAVQDHLEGIFTLNLDGSGLKPLARNGYRPRWSPDGRRLSWDDINDLYVMNADGSEQRKIADAGPGEQYLWGVWTPDGDKILAQKRTNYSSGGPNVAVDVATGAQTPFGSQGSLCEFTRDGSRLLARLGGWLLYRADGTEGVPLLPGITGSDCLSLSPDQRYGVAIGHTYDPNRIDDVYLWDLKTGEQRNLTNGAFSRDNQCPRFTPTGEWIVWGSMRDRSGGYDLWKMRPDGTGAVKILDGGENHRDWKCADVQPLRDVAPDPEPTLSERDPVAAVAAASGAEGAAIRLDASVSKPGADGAAIESYAWDLDGDGSYTDATGARPAATFPDEGGFPVSVLVTDTAGRTATATADVTVANAAPVITQAKLGDGEPANFTARVADVDAVTAKLYWNGSSTGEPATVLATGDGTYQVAASRTGGATSVRIEVLDGDGGSAQADAARVVAPVNGAPAAADAAAKTVVGESVDIALPATDPEGERLHYEIVDPPAHGSVQMRAASFDPAAPDVTYTAGDETGTVTFTYRVSDGTGTSAVATVTVEVTRPTVGDVPQPKPYEPATPEPARPARTGTQPVDQRAVERATAPPVPAASELFTLPSAKACVSRRHFRIRVKQGEYRRVLVKVNGKRVKTLRGKRITAGVDLRGLPKGRFRVQIAATLATGKVVKSTRTYRTCTKKSKKGGRS